MIDGFVHHWLAIGFIPGATGDQAVALAQDYPRHPEFYAPDVQRARVLSHVDQHFSVYYRFYQHAIVTRIVMNSALMINRKNRSARQISADELPPAGEPGLHFQIPDRAPNPEQTYVQRERRTILHSAIHGLRPRIRAVIEMAQFQELPIKETAKILDISVAAAKGRFFHARAALRKSVALRAAFKARTEPAA